MQINTQKSGKNVFIGILFGLLISAGLIFQNHLSNSAKADSGWWNDFIAGADSVSFDWEDVFESAGTSAKGKDLYNLVYKKLTRTAEKDALKDVASSFGLTIQEARAALNGSVSVLLNKRKNGQLTQDQAYGTINSLREKYQDIYDLYQIQQEMDVAMSSSEIFANGDLSDSGFDLVNDLTKIEEILFLDETDVTVGGEFPNAPKSPYLPSEAHKADIAGLDLANASGELAENSGSEESGDDSEDGFFESTDDVNSGVIAASNSDDAEILSTDICEDPGLLDQAINNFEENAGADGETGGNFGGDGSGGIGDDNGIAAGANGSTGGNLENENDEVLKNSDGSIAPAPKDKWQKVWCPGMPDPNDTPVFSGADVAGFASLAGGKPVLGAGAVSAGVQTDSFAVKMGLCFDVELIKKKIASYQPGDSCIACEVEKINQILNKTLSHSLVPNKATGNLLESAKCKDTGTLINFQFVTVWNPVPTPPNDDVIYGNNIEEDWNEFVERYKPLLLSDLHTTGENEPTQSENYFLELEKANASDQATQTEIFNRIINIKNKYKAEAALSVESFAVSSELENLMIYSREILGEVRQMNGLFTNFRETFKKINSEALQNIVTKPYLD